MTLELMCYNCGSEKSGSVVRPGTWRCDACYEERRLAG